MVNTYITGNGPFLPTSTFRSGSIVIPEGMFLGGRFYAAGDIRLPIHISYIAPGGLWGIADADGTEVATIKFQSNLGSIYTLNGDYAGCLKGRASLYNNPSADVGRRPGLVTFLDSITKRHTLDADSLVWDINWCSVLKIPDATVKPPAYKYIYLPENTVLWRSPTDYGMYVVQLVDSEESVEGAVEHSPLTTLNLGENVSLEGEHVLILPDSHVDMGDVVVANVAGELIISTHGRFPAQ